MALASTQLSSALQLMRDSKDGIERAIETMLGDKEQTKTRQFLLALTDAELAQVVAKSAAYTHVRDLAEAEQNRRVLDAPDWDNSRQKLNAALAYISKAHSSVELTPLQLQRIMASLAANQLKNDMTDNRVNQIWQTGNWSRSFRAVRMRQMIQVLPTNLLQELSDFSIEMTHDPDDYDYIDSVCDMCKEEIERRSALSHVYVDPRSGMTRVHSSMSDQDMEREIAAISAMSPDELKRRIAEIEARKSALWRDMTIANAMQAALQRRVDEPNSNCVIA